MTFTFVVSEHMSAVSEHTFKASEHKIPLIDFFSKGTKIE